MELQEALASWHEKNEAEQPQLQELRTAKGTPLKVWLAKHGMKKTELATITGLSRATIHRACNKGERIRLYTAVVIAQAIGVPESEIVREK